MARVHLIFLFCLSKVQAKFTLSKSILAKCILSILGTATVTTAFVLNRGIKELADIWEKEKS